MARQTLMATQRPGDTGHTAGEVRIALFQNTPTALHMDPAHRAALFEELTAAHLERGPFRSDRSTETRPGVGPETHTVTMFTSLSRAPRRRPPHRRRRASLVLTPLALAATTVLAAAPLAGAQSTLAADGTIDVSVLSSDVSLPAGSTALFGSLAETPYEEYVALGDSYAALGDARESAGGPASCARSLANYPHELDALDARVGELTDVTCGGAVIPDLFDTDSDGVPRQFDALGEDTDLVTLSIGGNDLGFGMIVGCITRQGPFADLPVGATCESAIGADVDAAIDATYGADGPIDDVYDEIAALSPDATVVATQYLPLMPTGDTTCPFTDTLHPADVTWAAEVTDDINAAVDAAATRNGHVSVMPTDTVDRSACAPDDQRWTSFLGAPDYTAAMHPTALGQEAMAAAISAEL